LSPHPADKRLLKKQAEKGNSCGSLFHPHQENKESFCWLLPFIAAKKNNPIVVYYSQATPLLFFFF
jgi:hypothetical protein